MSKSLYSAVPPGGNWRQNAVVGGYEDDLTLADGFFDAALLAFEKMSQRPDDGLFVPAMYNTRHAFELCLKEAVRRLTRLLRERAHDGGQPVDPAWQMDAVNRRLGSEHRLLNLSVDVQSYIAASGDIEPLPVEVIDVIHALHDLDPTGQGFRYSKVKDKVRGLVPARMAQSHVDVVAVRERLEAAYGLLAFGLVGGLLDHLLDLQQDYRAYLDGLGP